MRMRVTLDNIVERGWFEEALRALAPRSLGHSAKDSQKRFYNKRV